jgi:hypothetical protein
MSAVFGALMKAFALETQRMREVVHEASNLALPANLSEDLEMPATPTIHNKIDAVNLVYDPVGRSASWRDRWDTDSANSALEQIEVTDLHDWPYGVHADVITPASAMDITVRIEDGEIEAGGEFYWYTIIRSNQTAAVGMEVSLSQNFGAGALIGPAHTPSGNITSWVIVGGKGEITLPTTALTDAVTSLPSATINVASTAGFPDGGGTLRIGSQFVTYSGVATGPERFTGCAGGAGDYPVGTVVERTSPGPHKIAIWLGAPAAGSWLEMTGVTLVQGTDPGWPFSGDFPVTPRHAFGWKAGRFQSPSLRYGPLFDLMQLREMEADFSVAPQGMTLAQRQQYLLARWAAHRKPYGSVFKELITQLIQADDPTFTQEQVRVREDYSERTLRVEVDYAPSGVLTDRMRKLIRDIKPAGLNIDAEEEGPIVFGQFLADISAAGDPV